MKITLNQTYCTLEKMQYSNGRIAIEAIDTLDGELYNRLTVNLPDEPCEENQAYINVNHMSVNSYSQLIEQGVISKEVICYAQPAYVSYPLHTILI